MSEPCTFCGCPDCLQVFGGKYKRMFVGATANPLCKRKTQGYIKFSPCPYCGCLGEEVVTVQQDREKLLLVEAEKLGQELADLGSTFSDGSPVLEYEGENKQMITIPQRDNKGGRPSRPGLPFLKNENLSTTPTSAQIIAVKQGTDNKDKPQVMLKVAINGVTFLWNLRLNNPNLESLVNEFGADETKWAGKEILLANVLDEFAGRYWPTVSFHSVSQRKK